MGLSSAEMAEVMAYHNGVVGFCHEGHSNAEDRLHAATGIQEEANELLEAVALAYAVPGSVNRGAIKGEMGGTLWYTAYTAHTHGFDLGDVALTNTDAPEVDPVAEHESALHQAIALTVAARDVGSYIKKTTYHGKPLDTNELRRRLWRLWRHVALVGAAYGITTHAAMWHNLAELAVRHGGESFDPTVYTAGRK